GADESTVTKLQPEERPVVADRAHRPSDRRVDKAVRLRSRARGAANCVAQERTGCRGTARSGVDGGELGVVTEAAAGEIERTQLAREKPARSGESRWLRH